MKLCMPAIENNGINSIISEHFGSAPYFIIVDTDSFDCRAIVNSNQHHSHGMCHPLSVLGSEKFDGIVVREIGVGALNKLRSANIKVYKTDFATIKETVEAVKNNNLKEVVPHMACRNYRHFRSQP